MSRTRFRRRLKDKRRNACRVFRAIEALLARDQNFRRVRPRSENQNGRCGPGWWGVNLLDAKDAEGRSMCNDACAHPVGMRLPEVQARGN